MKRTSVTFEPPPKSNEKSNSVSSKIRSITFIISNRKTDEESMVPIELSAADDDRERYTNQIQEAFQRMRYLLDQPESDILPMALKRATRVAIARRSAVSFIFSEFSARSGPLYEIIRDADPLMKIDLIRVGDSAGQQIDEAFIKQCYQSNGIHVDIHYQGHMTIRHSSDMDMIRAESQTVEEYALKLGWFH